MSKSTIYIHVGYRKTGSSYIQTSLALSKELLFAQDFQYPIDQLRYKKAINHEITAGNLVSPVHSVADFLKFEKICKPNLIISSETLFKDLFQQGILDNLLKVFPKSTIKILLFIRDPIEHALSAYHQNIKSEGKVYTIEEFLSSYEPLGYLPAFLDTAREKNITLDILNYSRHKHKLIVCIEDWLGLKRDTLKRPRVKRINRSLTASELAFQKAFNSQKVGTGTMISNALCEHLPHIRHETPFISKDCLYQFAARMQEQISELNKKIPVAEHFRIETDFDKYPENSPQPAAHSYTFSEQQLAVLATSICSELKMLEGKILTQRAEKYIALFDHDLASQNNERIARYFNLALSLLEELTNHPLLYNQLADRIIAAQTNS